MKVCDDTATGKNGDRPEFRRMLEDAAKRRFDLVVFWALDRLTREGPLKTLLYLEQLASSGVKFKSFTEPMLDTTRPVGELLIPILSWVAKQERQRISDRTRTGLDTARRKGKKLGRPVGILLASTHDDAAHVHFTGGAPLQGVADCPGWRTRSRS